MITTDSAFFTYSSLLLLLLLLFVIGFPLRTRHPNVKGCSQKRICVSEGTEHWGFQEEPDRQCGGDQTNSAKLKFMQFFSFPVLPNTEQNGKEGCFISQLSWSPQLSSTWVIKLSTNSWKEQVFPTVNRSFHSVDTSSVNKFKSSKNNVFTPQNFSLPPALDQATEVASQTKLEAVLQCRSLAMEINVFLGKAISLKCWLQYLFFHQQNRCCKLHKIVP